MIELKMFDVDTFYLLLSVYFFAGLKSFTITIAFEKGHPVISTPILSKTAGIFGFQPLREENQLKVVLQGFSTRDSESKTHVHRIFIFNK